MSPPPGTAGAPPFVVVTGNPDKRREVERILGVVLESVDVDLPEIQSLDLEEVLRVKARTAFERVGRPLAVEETGFELDVMNGFPGPLVKWWLQAVGAEGLAGAAIAQGDPGATVRCLVMFFDGDREVIGEGVDRGRLVLPPRGAEGFGWDPVFEPAGSALTVAEAGDERKDRDGHRGRAWRDLVAKFAA